MFTGGVLMDQKLSVKLKPSELAQVTDDNLFELLEQLQEATRNVMMEGWRRGLQVELAEKAMELKDRDYSS